MNVYATVVFLHLLFLLLASATMSLTAFAAVRLRASGNANEAAQWATLDGEISHAFPVSVLGLLATGAYMTQQRWTWSMPWIDAALAGLALIVALGAGVEGGRTRMLQRELQSAGMAPHVRRLLRDPVSWTARTTGISLLLAVVFVMTVKPAATASVASILVAVAAGVIAAVPLWRHD